MSPQPPGSVDKLASLPAVLAVFLPCVSNPQFLVANCMEDLRQMDETLYGTQA